MTGRKALCPEFTLGAGAELQKESVSVRSPARRAAGSREENAVHLRQSGNHFQPPWSELHDLKAAKLRRNNEFNTSKSREVENDILLHKGQHKEVKNIRMHWCQSNHKQYPSADHTCTCFIFFSCSFCVLFLAQCLSPERAPWAWGFLTPRRSFKFEKSLASSHYLMH